MISVLLDEEEHSVGAFVGAEDVATHAGALPRHPGVD